MRTLTIECSSSVGSVALTENNHPIISRSFENPRGRGTILFSVLEEVIAESKSFDLVLVGTGPGSYNALRSSIAAAWGIAKARHIPVSGISSVFGYDAPEYFVVGDARSNQCFFGHVSDGRLTSPLELLSPETASTRLIEGVPIYSTSASLLGAEILHPSATTLARNAAQAGPAEPIYLKPPHITPSRPKTT